MTDANKASNRTGVIASLCAALALSVGSVVPAQAGLYFGVNSAMVSSDLDLDGIALISGTTNGLVQDDPRVALRFFGGWGFGDFLAVEGGYNDVDTIFAAVGTDNYHFDISGIDISVLGRIPLFKFLNQPIGVYVKVGAINWKSEVQVTQPSTVARVEEDGTDFLYGGGVEVILFKHILVRGGIDVLDIDPADAGAGNITLGGLSMGLSF